MKIIKELNDILTADHMNSCGTFSRPARPCTCGLELRRDHTIKVASDKIKSMQQALNAIAYADISLSRSYIRDMALVALRDGPVRKS